MSKIEALVPNLTRSCNEVLILSVLAGGARHGYQLAVEIEERSAAFFRFNHGTLYPILHKLERGGLIRGAWSGDDTGRKRKRYSLTAKGRGLSHTAISACCSVRRGTARWRWRTCSDGWESLLVPTLPATCLPRP